MGRLIQIGMYEAKMLYAIILIAVAMVVSLKIIFSIMKTIETMKKGNKK